MNKMKTTEKFWVPYFQTVRKEASRCKPGKATLKVSAKASDTGNVWWRF